MTKDVKREAKKWGTVATLISILVTMLASCELGLNIQSDEELDTEYGVKEYTYHDIVTINNFSDRETEEYIHVNDAGYVYEIFGEYTNIVIETEMDALKAFSSVNEMFGIKNPYTEFRWVYSSNDSYVTQHQFVQMYNGYEVVNSGIEVVQARDEEAKSFIISSVVPTEVLDGVADNLRQLLKITSKAAKEIVYKENKNTSYSDISVNALKWYPEYVDNTLTIRFVFEAEVEGSKIVYIDTASGEVVNTISTRN